MNDLNAALRRADQAAYVNHPDVAFRQMHKLAADVQDLIRALEDERRERRKLGQFLQATTATLVAERRAS